MTQYLQAASTDVLQERLIEEIHAQQRLQDELKTALETERNLRLENEVLWTYLQRKYPARVEDAADLVSRLTDGANLSAELQPSTSVRTVSSGGRSLRKRVRRRLGNLPGVHRAYHSLKNLGK